jgi:hypothetical protein
LNTFHNICWACSLQGFVDKYHFSKKWFYLYGEMHSGSTSSSSSASAMTDVVRLLALQQQQQQQRERAYLSSISSGSLSPARTFVLPLQVHYAASHTCICAPSCAGASAQHTGMVVLLI